MAVGAREDRFANVVSAKCVMSAINTITFVEMLTGISLGQGVGMLIDQIDYFPSRASVRELVAGTDHVDMGITTTDDMSVFDYQDRRIIHMMELASVGVATEPHLSPYVFQFFPPLIIATPRLYLGMDTTGAAAASTVQIRIYFRYIALTPQQYIELAEAFVLVG